MALNFPDSPADGDVYQNYVYSSAKGAWQAKPLKPAVAATQSNPPSAPDDGDMWFNTNDGTTYVWFDDGNSAQWVEMTAPITANGYYSPNYIINGGFDIWQRGTSFATGALAYTADRWQTARGAQVAGMTTSRQAVNDSTNLPNIRYCARVQRDSGNTSTNLLLISQSLETADSIPLAGKIVTISFYARAGANYSAASSALGVKLITGTGTDQNALSGSFTGSVTLIDQTATLTSTWKRFSFTAQVASNVTQISSQLHFAPTGTAGANDWYEFTGVQLEEGPVATPFRRNANSLHGELSACRRYFQAGVPGGAGKVNSSTEAQLSVAFTDLMRAAPSISQVATWQILNPGVAFHTMTAISSGGGSPRGAVLTGNSSGMAAGAAVAAVPSDGSLWFSAEL